MDPLNSILVIFILFLIAYKIIRKLIDSDFRKHIITGELTPESSKMTLKIRDWFTWNVQVNNEKGTAGGNIKVNFPIKSALGIAILCIVFAYTAHLSHISLIVTLIFLSFAVYHFRNWLKTLHFISAHEAFDNVKRLSRSKENKIIGGICGGIYEHFQTSVLLVRFLFIVLGLTGIGIYLYILLWLILPLAKNSAVVNPI